MRKIGSELKYCIVVVANRTAFIINAKALQLTKRDYKINRGQFCNCVILSTMHRVYFDWIVLQMLRSYFGDGTSPHEEFGDTLIELICPISKATSPVHVPHKREHRQEFSGDALIGPGYRTIARSMFSTLSLSNKENSDTEVNFAFN